MSDSLPAGWESADLVDVCDILDSRRVPVNKEEREQRRGTVPYYGATGQVGWIDDALFNEQLVLLGEDGAPFLDPLAPKAYAISGPSWVNNHAHVLRARSGVSHRFLMHQLNILDFGQYVSGTTRLKLPQGPMRRMRLRLAPTAEQDRIVVAIEEHLSRLDAAVAALEHVRAAVPRYRGAVLKAACNGVLVETEADLAGKEGRAFESAAAGIARIANGTSVQPDTNNDLPSGWGRTSLSAIGVLDRGRSKHRPRDEPRLYGGPYPFVQTSDIKRSGGFVRQHSQTYSEAGLAQSRLWPSGTLAITIAANIAETGILTYPACFPDSVVGFVFDGDSVTVRFVDLFFRTEREEIARFAPATAQKNINLEILSEV